MKYILIILLLTSLPLFAQNNIEVSYLIQYNTEIPNQKTAALQIDFKHNKSLFFTSKGTLKSGATEKDNIITIFQKFLVLANLLRLQQLNLKTISF